MNRRPAAVAAQARARTLAALLAAVVLSACGPDQTECRDGSHTATTGQGACSHHGGVKRTGGAP